MDQCVMVEVLEEGAHPSSGWPGDQQPSLLIDSENKIKGRGG